MEVGNQWPESSPVLPLLLLFPCPGTPSHPTPKGRIAGDQQTPHLLVSRASSRVPLPQRQGFTAGEEGTLQCHSQQLPKQYKHPDCVDGLRLGPQGANAALCSGQVVLVFASWPITLLGRTRYFYLPPQRRGEGITTGKTNRDQHSTAANPHSHLINSINTVHNIIRLPSQTIKDFCNPFCTVKSLKTGRQMFTFLHEAICDV